MGYRSGGGGGGGGGGVGVPPDPSLQPVASSRLPSDSSPSRGTSRKDDGGDEGAGRNRAPEALSYAPRASPALVGVAPVGGREASSRPRSCRACVSGGALTAKESRRCSANEAVVARPDPRTGRTGTQKALDGPRRIPDALKALARRLQSSQGSNKGRHPSTRPRQGPSSPSSRTPSCRRIDQRRSRRAIGHVGEHRLNHNLTPPTSTGRLGGLSKRRPCAVFEHKRVGVGRPADGSPPHAGGGRCSRTAPPSCRGRPGLVLPFVPPAGTRPASTLKDLPFGAGPSRRRHAQPRPRCSSASATSPSSSLPAPGGSQGLGGLGLDPEGHA